jgi:hypothetical protein
MRPPEGGSDVQCDKNQVDPHLKFSRQPRSICPGIEAKHETNFALLSAGPRTDELFVGLLGVLVTNAAVAEAGIVGPERCRNYGRLRGGSS